jgi:hypothetical protein
MRFAVSEATSLAEAVYPLVSRYALIADAHSIVGWLL